MARKIDGKRNLTRGFCREGSVMDSAMESVVVQQRSMPDSGGVGDGIDSPVPKQLTCEDVLEKIGVGWRQAAVVFLCADSYFAFSAEILVPVLFSEAIMKYFQLSKYEYGLISFFPAFFTLAGGQFWGWLADQKGRRFVFSATLWIAAIFGILCSAAPSFAWLVALRCCMAWGTTGVSTVDFIYAIEMLPPSARKRTPTLITVFGSAGALYISFLAAFVEPKLGWRWVVGLSAAPMLLTALLRFFISIESPRYLIAAGMKDKAVAVLETLSASKGKSLNRVLGQEGIDWQLVAEVHTSDSNIANDETKGLLPTNDKPSSRNYREREKPGVLGRLLNRFAILFHPDYWSRTVALSLLLCLQNLGYWGCNSFLPLYYKLVGLPAYRMFMYNVIAQPFGLLLSAFLVGGESRFQGRIPALRLFSFGAIFAFCSVAVAVGIFPGNEVLKWSSAITLKFFTVPLWSILNIIVPESYPTSTRGTAASFIQFVGGLPYFVSYFAGAYVLNASDAHPYMFPVVWAALYAVFFSITFGLKGETSKHRLVDSV